MTDKNIITYGCRLNIYESEVIQKHMDEAGLKNYILFNSCSVTNEAKKKVINDIKKAKKISPQKKIIVTGCASQIDSEFFTNMTEVDHVIGNKEKMELNTYLSLKNRHRYFVMLFIRRFQSTLSELKLLVEKELNIAIPALGPSFGVAPSGT